MNSDEKSKRIATYNGISIQLSPIYAPVDIFLYKDGYNLLLSYIKTSPTATKKFLSHHHLTPLHRVLKYKDAKGRLHTLSNSSVYDYICMKKQKYIDICKSRSLTLYEKNRLNHYTIMEDSIFPWVTRLIKNTRSYAHYL